MPETVIAAPGRTGQKYSHAPHPTQRSTSTAMSLLPPDCGTIWMAPAGQLRAHVVHSTFSLCRMQSCLFIVARPICIALLSATVKASIAPVGQMFEQAAQFGRQYPRSNEREGCNAPVPLSWDTKTWFGQFDTQSWQPVHLEKKLCCPNAPGGRMGTLFT